MVTGCYAQRAPEELAAMDGVAAVVGNSYKALAPEIIFGLAAGKSPSVHPMGENAALVSVGSLLASNGGSAPDLGRRPVCALVS